MEKTAQEQLQEAYLSMKGILSEADNKIVTEILALDELSKATLGSYVKSAAWSVGDLASQAHNPFKTADERAGKFGKSLKRIKGIAKATNRLTKEQKETIESILEELEEDNLTLEDFTLDELEDFVLSEDFDQLDEVSGELLGRYVQKARADAKAKYAHGKELDNHPKVKALGDKLRDLYNRREYTKSGDSKHRKTIDKTHDKIYDTKKKIDPNYPKSANGAKRYNGVRKAIEKLQHGKLTNESSGETTEE